MHKPKQVHAHTNTQKDPPVSFCQLQLFPLHWLEVILEAHGQKEQPQKPTAGAGIIKIGRDICHHSPKMLAPKFLMVLEPNIHFLKFF